MKTSLIRLSRSPVPRAPHLLATLLLCLGIPHRSGHAVDANRAANSVILTAIQAENLGIESVEADFETFETTVFAIGQLEEQPAARSVLSSRVAGRAVEVRAFVGDIVTQGDTLVVLESLQPGDPPPRIPLKAASSGTVVASHVHLGQPIEPSNELLHIADHSLLRALATVPEHAAGSLSAGSIAHIRIPSAPGHNLTARLARFDPQANPSNGTMRAIFEIPNAQGDLLPGMRAEFSLVTARRENVMAVPIECIQGTQAAPLVFVRDFELPNVFVRAPVVLGERNATHVEIIKGLFPGDEVITTGSYGLDHAGGASAMSLKEVLDAAHGHEHNEDGSEMTAEQKAAHENESTAADGESHSVSRDTRSTPGWLPYYAGASTIALLVALQVLWSRKRGGTPPASG